MFFVFAYVEKETAPFSVKGGLSLNSYLFEAILYCRMLALTDQAAVQLLPGMPRMAALRREGSR